MKKEIIKFLQQSNYIEKEYSDEALEDAKEAWVYAVSKDIESIDINYILEIHKLLLQRLRPDIAGKFRTCDVWIGGSPKKVVSQSVFKSELRDIIATMKTSNFIPDKEEEFAKHCHVMFEMVHSFEDGNGRTGRILWQIHRLKLGLPIKVIKEGKEQMEYYKWFK
ncbi:hypothetical protein LCGC14_2796110 [marine sediment metagenome]|uniref:Fido domain-containing protein n=1 Tax=marine sediment metagenome TaxID=412755 RepID=A0A0F9BFH5_9ZZZZ